MEKIWLKVTIFNSTDKDYYITYLPDKLSVPLKIESNNGNDNIRLREIDERMGPLDSVKVLPHSSFVSLINLTQNYFDQRYVTKGIYDIKGSYDKYSQLKYAYLIPDGKKINYPSPLQSNSIKVEILPPTGKEEKIYNILFYNTDKKFKSQIEKWEYLTDEFPNSKFYPQVFSMYIYYLTSQSDNSILFKNVNLFFENVDSYQTIEVLNTLSTFFINNLRWDSEKIKKYFISLKERYPGKKLIECIDAKLAIDDYYRSVFNKLNNKKIPKE